jgi:hypothetical protein
MHIVVRALSTALPALALIATLTAARTAAAQPTDPPGVVASFGDATNAHNVEAAMGLLADGATVTTPFATYTGSEQLRGWLRANFAQNVRSETVGTREVTGERVTWLSRIAIDEWRGLGVAPLETRVEAVVRGGKIASINYTFTPEAATRLRAAQARASTAPAQVPSALPRTGQAPTSAVPLPLLAAMGAASLLGGVTLLRRCRST